MKLKLKFAKGNAKLAKHIAIFSLPAGHTCAGALQCMARADKETGKITDGKHMVFRCYAATSENMFPNVRESRWNNLALLKACKGISHMAQTIIEALPKKCTHVRIHQSGDYFTQSYFDAWLEVARRQPNRIFYGYTKMLPFWIARLTQMPANFKLTASRGGKWDTLIDKHGLKCVEVVLSEAEAKQKGLPIDHDDSNCYKHNKSFALLIHGTQPAGSVASKTMSALRNAGKNGYKADYFGHYAK